MREGAVVLLPLTQADGKVKPRPAVALRQLPGFGDWLVCGISTQLHQLVSGFDEQVSVKDSDFSLSGLTEPSIIRLSFLQSVRLSAIMGRMAPFLQTATAGFSQIFRNTWHCKRTSRGHRAIIISFVKLNGPPVLTVNESIALKKTATP